MSTKHARQLRKTSTPAEQRLWNRLRRNQIGGHHFRRQVPIGPYVADFVCVLKKLVVEVDGSQHVDQVQEDAVRTRYLERRGYRVLRFWNNAVLTETDSVVEAIFIALEEG